MNATHVEVRTDAASLFPEPKSTQGQTKCFCCSLFLEHERMLSGNSLLYSIIIIRILTIGAISRSNFSRLFCFGFAFAIFIYIVVNLSMVLGLLPIVGSPLPIMSYGGSSMLATMIGFGIVLSAKVHSQQTIS